MLALSAQESMDDDNLSMTSSSVKPGQSPPPTQRINGAGNETNATKVFVRVRPFSAAERRQSGSGDPPAIVTVSDDNPSHITTLDPSKHYMPKTTYAFDRCFNSAALSPAAVDDAQLLLLSDGKGDGAALSTLEDVAAESQLNPLQLERLSRDQAAVYGHVGRPVLMNALAGYNGCVFAYGQTGSGKTYTMMGPPGTFGAVVTSAASTATAAAGGASPSPGTSKKFRRAATGYGATGRTSHDGSGIDDAGDSRFQSYASMTPRMTLRSPPEDELSPRGPGKTVEGDEGLQGIVPRLVRDLFAELHLKRERDSSHSFRVEVEYYEIYREKVMDLLGPHSASTNTELRVRQSKTSGPYVENLKKRHVEDERHVFRLLRQGNLRRHTAATAMNDRSSRSHAIFVLHLVQMRIADDVSASAKVTSKVNLVDLAGSEKTGAHNAEGDQFKEGVVINISLTVLGRVIDALADKSQGKRNVFCPFRDSVLTWLLMDSLGGNSKTTMVATVSPHCTNFEEACQTLRYASRAKQIVTKVVVNEDPQVRQIKALTAEVQRLKALLAAEGKVADNDDDVEALQDRIQCLETELNETRTELEEKSAELSTLQAMRRTVSTLPSTLKPGNAGVAGTAKELSKAKSDVRRLEAENLLHLQTEEELHRALERVKTLESKYGQVLSDLKESQESNKKLEKDRQERERRLLDLQQLLGQEKLKSEGTERGSSRTVSPGGASVRSATTTASTAAAVADAGGASPAARRSALKTPLGKKPGGKKSKSAASAVAPPAKAEEEWVAERAELQAQFEEEKKLLSLQMQERSDAYRKAQLEIKKLKGELKNEQDTIMVIEKRLSDEHAEATRRLHEEVQELRRTIKDERRSNKDIRQVMAGPVEKRPVFSLSAVSATLEEHETVDRAVITASEADERGLLAQLRHQSCRDAERAAQVSAQHTAQLSEVQAGMREQSDALTQLRAKHSELHTLHKALERSNEDHLAALVNLRVELKVAAMENETLAATHQKEMADRDQQLDALRATLAEKEATAAEREQRQQSLDRTIASLQHELQLRDAKLAQEAAARVRAAAEHATALQSATAAEKAAQDAHLREVTATHAAAVAEWEVKCTAAHEQLATLREELKASETQRAAEQERGAAQAAEHQRTIDDLHAQVAREREASAAAQETHNTALHALESKLAAQASETAATMTAMRQQLDTLQQDLNKQAAEKESAIHSLETKLEATLATVADTENARTGLQQEVERQRVAHAEELAALRSELDAERTAKAATAGELALTAQRLKDELQKQQEEAEAAQSKLSQQVAELQTTLAEAEAAHQAEAARTAEVSKTQETSLAELRADLERERAAQAALAAAHAEEVQAMRTAHTSSEAAAQAQAAQLSEQLDSARAEAAAAQERHAQEKEELTTQLEAVQAQLHRSEESRKQQVQRAVEKASEHANAMDALQGQLTAAKAEAAEHATAHEQQVHALEAKHTEERNALTAAKEALEQQLEVQVRQHCNEQAEQQQRLTLLEETLQSVREELRKSEEARKTYIAHTLEQTAALEGQLTALRDELKHEREDAEVAAGEHQKIVESLNANQRQQQEEAEAAQSRLSRQVVELQTTLAEAEAAHQAEAARTAEVSKTQETSLAELRADLERERAAQAALAAAHAEEVQAMRTAHTSSEAAAQTQVAQLSEQLDSARAEAAAAQEQHAQETEELTTQLEAVQAQLHRSEESRKQQVQRAVEEAHEHAEHEKAWEAKLAEAAAAAAAERARHTAELEALQQQMAEKETAAAAELREVQEQARDTEARLHEQLQQREQEVATLSTRAETAEGELATSEAARKAYVERSVAQAKESSDALSVLQAQLHAAQADAQSAAEAHAKRLDGVQRELEQQRISAEATSAALHRELDVQRQASAAEAIAHTRAVKELEDKLAATHAELAKAAEAQHAEQARSATQAAEHAAVLAALQAELTKATEAREAADAAHAAAQQRLVADWTSKYEEKSSQAASLQHSLQHTKALLEQAEQARNEQAEEGMRQAEAHTHSLEALQKMLETSHKQQLAALKKSHADYVAPLEQKLATQTSALQTLKEDLVDTRAQVKQLVGTQNYLGTQLESEKQSSTALRMQLESTEKARAAAAAEAVLLQTTLTKRTAEVQRLTESAARLTAELEQARKDTAETRQRLSEQEQLAAQQHERLQEQASALAASQATAEKLQGEVQALEAEKDAIVKAHQAQEERQREQLVTQQVDTVTELETQFRAMEAERLHLVREHQQALESLQSINEKQAKELRQLREDLDFNISLNHLETNGARMGTAPTTVTQSGAGGDVNRSATPIPTTGGVKPVTNGSFTSRAASPMVGSSVKAGMANMFSSFFGRGTSGAMPAPTTVNSAATPQAAQVVQRRTSVLRARAGGDARPGAVTPVRRGSNFYTTSSFRASPGVSFLSKGEAPRSGSVTGTGMGRRTLSNASLDSYTVEQEDIVRTPLNDRQGSSFFPN